VLESGLQKAVKIAVDRAGITKRVGTHTLRHYAEFQIMPSKISKFGESLAF
jgi:site-specific recombinase XerD